MKELVRKPWALWILAQLVNLGIAGLWGLTIEDVHYYFKGITNPLAGGLKEYPDASLWPIRIIESMSGHSIGPFSWIFLLFNVAISGLFMLYFSKQPPTIENIRAARFWALFNLCMGPLILTRLDLAVGLLVASFVVLCGTRWGSLAPLLLSYATMMKLSPGVIAVSLVGRITESKTWIRIAVFVAGLAGFAAITLSHSGIERMLSPLTYQEVRGLQIESIVASPFVLGAALFDNTWTIRLSQSKSYEITGPGIEYGLSITNILMVIAVVGAVGLALLQLFRSKGKPGWSADYVMHVSLAVILALIVANKVFSPQYLMWAAPLVALVLTRENRPRLARAFLGTAFLSAVIFPYAYLELTDGPALWITLILCLRNALVVYTCYVCIRNLLAFMFPSPRKISLGADELNAKRAGKKFDAEPSQPSSNKSKPAPTA